VVGTIDEGKWGKVTEMHQRVYSPQGLCPTLCGASGGNTEKKIILEDFYPNRIRTFENTAPTIRAGREGLKVVALRGRQDGGAEYIQTLEARGDDCTNTLTSVSKDNMLLHNCTIRKLTERECWQQLTFGGIAMGNRSNIRYRHELNYDIDFNYNYTTPIENGRVDYVRLVCERFTWSGSQNTQFPITNAAATFIMNMFPQVPFPTFTVTQVENRLQELNAHVVRPANPPAPTRLSFDFDISNVQIESFRIRFNGRLNRTLTSTFAAGVGSGIYLLPNPQTVLPPVMGNLFAWDANYTVYQPLFIEVSVRGDTYRITPQAFQHGEIKNAFEVHQNSLITTKTTKGDPYTRVISDKMTSEWGNGKRAFNVEVTAPNEIHEIQDDIKIMQVRRGEINENNPQEVNNASVIQNPNGEAVNFEVTSAEFRYNGASQQTLDVLEKT